MLGTERFTARDGFNGIPTEYVVPVMQYAASKYGRADLDNALTQGWITQDEYDQTLTYV
jgi:hypothetical protein